MLHHASAHPYESICEITRESRIINPRVSNIWFAIVTNNKLNEGHKQRINTYALQGESVAAPWSVDRLLLPTVYTHSNLLLTP